MRVLVIEDDPMIGRAVVAGLQDAGYTVDWVRDGAEAELALGHHLYDLALLDLGLPQIDGLDVCRRLRSDHTRSYIPIVMVTALGNTEQLVQGLDAWADDYITKPFSSRELMARVQASLRIRRMGVNRHGRLVYDAGVWV